MDVDNVLNGRQKRLVYVIKCHGTTAPARIRSGRGKKTTGRCRLERRKDGIREKDGKSGVYSDVQQGDSVRQALAEDTANQLKGWALTLPPRGRADTAYDRAQSEPLIWGWGAHTPMELYNIYHTLGRIGQAEYSPYANVTVDKYMDEALETGTLEESYELWQKAQWDGTLGITQDGDIPWIWLCNVDHLYFVRDGLQIAEQKIHPHGHGWSIFNNVDQWSWE
ncbi:MAG: hypothetical protein ACLUOI_18255 [Eisenbergiella sp.]